MLKKTAPALIISIFTVGCTSLLWSPDYEQVSISRLYINTETDELLAANDSHAYIFQMQDNLSYILTSSQGFDLKPVFWDFALDSENNVSGRLQLVVWKKPLTDEESAELRKLGFSKMSDFSAFSFEQIIEGKKYAVDGEIPLEALEVKYTVPVAQPSTSSQSLGKLLASPATIAYDAVVVVPAVFVGATVMAVGGDGD